MDCEYKLKVLESLLSNKVLFKNEVKIMYFCLDSWKISSEIGKALDIAIPNVHRDLLIMTNKGYLKRKLREDGMTYLYTYIFEE